MQFKKKYLFYLRYFNYLKKLFDDEKNLLILDEIKKSIIKCKKRAGVIYIIGNGGSSSTASHISVDLTKNAKINSKNFNESNLITCFSNDFGFENYVAKCIELNCYKKDLIIFLSCSGNSKNLLNAAKFCKKNKIKFITFTGRNYNNSLRRINSKGLNIWVNSNAYNLIESIHFVYLASIVDSLIGKINYNP
jgi:D-sedoheptulose 7-phosphate isomerase